MAKVWAWCLQVLGTLFTDEIRAHKDTSLKENQSNRLERNVLLRATAAHVVKVFKLYQIQAWGFYLWGLKEGGAAYYGA